MLCPISCPLVYVIHLHIRKENKFVHLFIFFVAAENNTFPTQAVKKFHI